VVNERPEVANPSSPNHSPRRPDAWRALYPFLSRDRTIDGHRLHYVDEGKGPVVVMLHGNPTWSFHFRELIKGLRDRFRVIAPDHMGCGLSDKPRDYPYTLSTHIRNLTRLLDELSVERASLVVHDWGGPIGFGWAVSHPDRVSRLVVFNTAVFFGGRMPWRIRLCRRPVIGDLIVRGLNGFVRGALLTAAHRRERLTAAVRDGYLHPYRDWASRIGIRRFVADIPLHERVPSYPVLREIEAGLPSLRTKPLWIGWGLRDWCFTEAFLRQWIERRPDAEVHRYPDAGHYVVEDAHERILPAVIQFLERPARESVP
jgi:haloalkane dehalogenase